MSSSCVGGGNGDDVYVPRVLVTDVGSEPAWALFGDDVEEAEGLCNAVSMALLLLFGDEN
jgi:hypothetical protein